MAKKTFDCLLAYFYRVLDLESFELLVFYFGTCSCFVVFAFLLVAFLIYCIFFYLCSVFTRLCLFSLIKHMIEARTKC